MKIKEKVLKEKGWDQDEIDEAKRIIEDAEKEKHPAISFLDRASFWISLVLAILAGFVLSIILIPLLLSGKTLLIYIVVAVFGLSFGITFSMLLMHMDHIKSHHYVIHWLASALVGVLSFATVITITNRFAAALGIGHNQSIVGVSAVYVVSIIIPQIIINKIKR